MILPERIVTNEDTYGHCIIKGDVLPAVKTLNCRNYKIYTVKTERHTNYSRVDFVVKNVTKTCKYLCFLSKLYAKKSVTVVGM